MGYGAPVEDSPPCQGDLVWEEIASEKDTFLGENGQKYFKKIMYVVWIIFSSFGPPPVARDSNDEQVRGFIMCSVAPLPRGRDTCAAQKKVLYVKYCTCI